MAKNISNLDKSLKQNITPEDIGAAAASHGTHLTIGTGSGNAAAGNHTHSNYATSSHNHGLLHDNFTVEVANTTTDNGWSMINSSYNGYLLKSMRFGASSPAWGAGNYGSGIAFGGGDTKGVISMAYNSPSIKFAAGNGTKPVWNIGLTGTSGTNYNLNNFASSSHGTHVPTPQTASNTKFLRNDNTWQDVTCANIGAATAGQLTATNANIGTLSSLQTSNKSNLVAAINEVFQSGANVKQQLVDALVANGIDCSTSDSFGDLIAKINVLTADCTNITLDKSSLAFSVAGETQTLMATVTPSDFPKDIIWDSTNDNVAIVSNGQVTAVDTGECTVSALAGTKFALCNIEVSLSEGYLVKDGKLINSGKFGDYVTDDTRVIYNESNKRLEISAMNRTTMFSFNKFNKNNAFANGGVIEITAYRQQLYGAVPYIFVALVDEPLCIGDSGFLDNCYTVSRYVNARIYTTMNGGTTVTKYNFSLSGLQNYEGFLAIIISSNNTSTGYVYINDIKYTVN